MRDDDDDEPRQVYSPGRVNWMMDTTRCLAIPPCKETREAGESFCKKHVLSRGAKEKMLNKKLGRI